jgi:dipeptidyl aminopeptidase/acylaminoacyl peptidase
MRTSLVCALALLVLAVPASATTTRILPFQDVWPVYSPSGKQIAFTRISGNSMALEIIDLRSRTVRTIARNAGQLEPSWAQSGALAYTSFGHVYVLLDGRRTDRGPGVEPALSPDGSRLAVLRANDLLVDRVGWASGAIGRPAWAPDGTRITYARDDGIYVASGPAASTRLATSVNGSPGSPVWSPDGSSIAFVTGSRVWVVPADGSSGPKAISPVFADVSPLSWSRQSDAVVYTRRGGTELSYTDGHSALLLPVGGLGAAFSPVNDTAAFSGPRPTCPGHSSIRVYIDNEFNGPVEGTCEVRGTPRIDVIEGSDLPGDVILAGAGNDRVHANDGHTDRVNCGPGRDVVWADRTDRLTGCELIHR